ncbi:formin-like 2 domain protein (macronuclear) [Tetrahymena thermophila SB210]|uniref:Formin-like 2 domain protein n=1 Tax=Tetrahymena thermophila (strain SB210) TaxID=312017 RepID=Q23JZ2_TETTS|nr:formin-like 2 domain protein [Tetrahymena thermophila SB210]EAR97051.2 formin-like 2 domain protein [Tetrahymena thermophila SB210]|eukprot:XP_001017296.2 formin-like 2 domain protein [Tetrahymena thermophila SB210]
MGQQSAKPELDQQIRYRFKGYPDEIELVFGSLKNKHRFQKKIPSDKILQKDFENFASKLIASEDQKQIIYNLPKKYKWRLLNKHQDIMEGKSQKNITKTPLQKLLERLIEEQSVYAYNNLFDQIELERKQNDEIFWKDFKNYRGPQILIDIISNQNTQSRQSGKYDLLIKLFEFIHYMVTTFDQGIDYLKRVPNGIQTIVSCINPYHPMVTAYVFDVSSQFLLGNDEDLESVCRGFSEYKINNSLSSRFQILIDILKDSPNIILIRNTVDFLFSFISLPSNKQRAKLIRQEFIELNIENIFEIILTRIKLGKYKIKDCTQQAYLNALKNQIQEQNYFEDGHIDQNNSNLKMMLLSKKNEQEDIIKEESEEAETVDYNSLADKLENFEEEKQEDDEVDEEVDRLLLLSCTLNEGDTKIFQLHIQGIKNQMQLFLTFNLDDSEKTILDPVDSVFVKPQNYEITFESLIEKLKKKAFENDCYDQLTGSLQKLLLLPSDQDKVKKVFINLDKALSKIFASPQGVISEKELNALVESNKDMESLIKQINQLEEQNRIKDSEISGILQQKDDISAKFIDLKNQTKEMESQIQTLLKEINQLKAQIVNNQESSNIPSAPQLGIPQAPSIGGGIPPAPILGSVPQAPTLGDIPTAPPIFGIPPAPQIGGIPPAPPIGGIPPPPPPFGQSPAINLGGAPMPPPFLIGTQAPMMPSFNMPMMMPQQPLQKQKKKPNVPLKPFMWNTITANNIKNTIWEKLNDEKVELDIKFIEDQFEKPTAPVKQVGGASSQPNGSNSNSTQGSTTAPPKPMIIQKTSLINGDRTKTYEIVLQKLKISSNLISNALVSCDEKILTLNNLQSLNNICPKQEEVDLVTGYIEGGGKPEDLANPEKFIYEVKKVKGFGDRIRGLIFLKTHEEMFLDLEPKVQKLRRGIFYLKDNKLIPEMLEYVLAFGNYLNGESARGGAWGFKFDSLIKISELKMKDNKTTLMMYVIDIFEKKYNPLISLEDEEALNLCEQLPISQLNADLNEIKKNFRFMQKAIQSQTDLPNDNIKSKLDGSVDAIEQRINSMDVEIKTIDETYKQVASLYGEKPTDPSEKFAEKFGQLFRKIKKEKADKQKIEEAKKKEEEKKKKEEEKKAKEDLKTSTSKVDQKQAKPDLKASTSNVQQKNQVPEQSVSNPQQNLASIMKGFKSQLSQKANQKVENLENVRGTFIGMQNLNSGDVRMSKCYQNVRESMLMTKNKSDMLGLLKEMKMKKQSGIQQSGGEGGEDLQSAISKIGFLNK